MLSSGYYSININPYEDEIRRQMSDLQCRCNYLEIENGKLKQMMRQLKHVLQLQQQSREEALSSKKKKRRPTYSVDQKFKCPYDRCEKTYGSDLALNLHIKTKHNGGTKTFRESLAREIVLAEQKGEPMPVVEIEFPPGYLQEFKKRFFHGV